MAEYIIQSETLEEIGNQIRSRTGRTDLLSPTEMASHVQLVYAKGYTNGKENLKKEEARTWEDVSTYLDLDSKIVEVDLSSGYYAGDTLVTVDVQEVYDAGHTEGYTEGAVDGYLDGYDDGYSVGFGAGMSGGVADPTTVWEMVTKPNFTNLPTNVTISFNSAGIEYVGIYKPNARTLQYKKADGLSTMAYGLSGWSNDAYRTITVHEEITDEAFRNWLYENATLISGNIGGSISEAKVEEMIISTDENYEDEGKQFYNVYKWIDIWNSSLSSAPVVISAMNRHPTMWVHAYIRWTDAQGGYVNNLSMAIPPDDGENSIEIDIPVESYVLEGVRWSNSGI